MPPTDQSGGLTTEEARRRYERYGPNSLPEPPGEPLWHRVLRQSKSPLAEGYARLVSR